MAIGGQRKRSGGARKGGGASGGRDLVSALQGLSELTGNRALVGMLARKRGQPEAEQAEAFDADTLEEMLAKLRLLLDAEPPEELADLKQHILLLLAVLHGALDQAEGYDGDLLDEFERLSQVPDEPGEHRGEGLLALLHALARNGEEIHSALATQLDGGKPPKAPQSLVHRLKDDARELQDQIEADRPPKNQHAHAESGAGALDLLQKKKKQR